jgi:hypothetical protein
MRALRMGFLRVLRRFRVHEFRRMFEAKTLEACFRSARVTLVRARRSR